MFCQGLQASAGISWNKTSRPWSWVGACSFLNHFPFSLLHITAVTFSKDRPCKPCKSLVSAGNGFLSTDSVYRSLLKISWQENLVILSTGWLKKIQGVPLNLSKLRGEKVYWLTRANCRRAEKYGDIRWKCQCPFSLLQHTEKVLEWFLPKGFKLDCSSSVVVTTNHHWRRAIQLETFGRNHSRTFSVCCSKANGHWHFHLNKLSFPVWKKASKDDGVDTIAHHLLSSDGLIARCLVIQWFKL